MKELNKPNDSETIQVNGILFSHKNIFSVVDHFYTRIQADPALQIPFQSVENWPEHIKKLTHFWWTRFGGRTYLGISYDPVTKHFFAGFNSLFLERWLAIFHDTLKVNLNPDQVAIWKLISERMGEALSIKDEIYRRDHE